MTRRLIPDRGLIVEIF